MNRRLAGGLMAAALLFGYSGHLILAQGMGSGPRAATRPVPPGVGRLKPPPFRFESVPAARSGLVRGNRYGNAQHHRFILEMTGNGVAIADTDRDGHPDLIFNDGQTPALYRNRGDGTFADQTAASGLMPRPWGQGVCAGDFDNDGWTDIALTYYGPTRLYRNESGRFRDITAEAGLPLNGTPLTTSCAFADYDRDGRLDLVLSNYVAFDLARAQQPGASKFCTWQGLAVFCGPRGFPTDRPRLFRNQGQGRFRDVSATALKGIEGLHYGLGVVTGDFDEDGWPDLYIACDSTPGLLLHNQKDGTFRDIAVEAGAAYGGDGEELGSMGVAAADVDGDGLADLVKTNFIGETPSLYRNLGGMFFEDGTYSAGLGTNTSAVGWGIAAADFDHDGRPDLVMANGHIYPELGVAHAQARSFYWNGGRQFADVSASAGAAVLEKAVSRGLATGDLDGDGALEVVIVNRQATPALWRNRAAKGASLILQLEGTAGNRSAIGARVRVSAGGRVQVQEVRSGGSYASQSDLALHFGLGVADQADAIEIHWPLGRVDRLEAVPAGSRLQIREGEGIIGRRPFRATP